MQINKPKTSSRIFLILGLIGLDQSSKYIVRLCQVADDGFYICNKGISFSIQIPEKIFFFLWIVVVIFLLRLISREKSYSLRLISYVLILSGALSNMLDRIFHGCVIDFIDMHFFPVFNVADIFISIGAAGIVYVLYKKNKADLAL